MSDLYQSGYKPPRMPRIANLERASMVCSGKGQAGDIMRRYYVSDDWGDPVEAVGWFAEYGDGGLIALVADYANGERVELRCLAGGRSKVRFYKPLSQAPR